MRKKREREVQKHQQQQQPEPGPVLVHNRPVKDDLIRVVAKIEVDRGDFVVVHLTMPASELLERAERADIPEMWPIVSERLKREVLRREQ